MPWAEVCRLLIFLAWRGLSFQLPMNPIAHLPPVGGPARQGASPQVQLKDLSIQAEVGLFVGAAIWVARDFEAGPATDDEDPPAVVCHRQT